MWGNTEIGAAIRGEIGTQYLCFTYTPTLIVSLLLESM